MLLSALPDGGIDRRLAECMPERTTPHTLTRITEIRARIMAAREGGVAYTDELLELGQRSVAVRC
ncbi:MAG: hypothetical protein GEU74_12090 [Nitriliruptorales bacterium]|nr:hypothetical protein [Nitriliruptorales bacterium]